jgi:hypothetical protein
MYVVMNRDRSSGARMEHSVRNVEVEGSSRSARRAGER